jgi:hypothetical protein
MVNIARVRCSSWGEQTGHFKIAPIHLQSKSGFDVHGKGGFLLLQRELMIPTNIQGLFCRQLLLQYRTLGRVLVKYQAYRVSGIEKLSAVRQETRVIVRGTLCLFGLLLVSVSGRRTAIAGWIVMLHSGSARLCPMCVRFLQAPRCFDLLSSAFVAFNAKGEKATPAARKYGSQPHVPLFATGAF